MMANMFQFTTDVHCMLSKSGLELSAARVYKRRQLFDWKQFSLAKVDPMNFTQSTEPHRSSHVFIFSIEIIEMLKFHCFFVLFQGALG